MNACDTVRPTIETHAAGAWYAVSTRYRHERIVRDELQRKGIEHFLPTIRTVSRWKDRAKELEQALFPGYCFVRIDLCDRLRVLETRGVVHLVGNTRGPIPLPTSEIASLQVLMRSDAAYGWEQTFRTGMAVQVIRGPLHGVRGVLIRMVSACRLLLGVQLIQQAASVEIDADSVMPITSSADVRPTEHRSSHHAVIS
jgi:transcription termination/antitermination protein NusG